MQGARQNTRLLTRAIDLLARPQPLELAWSKVNAILRSYAARTYEDLEHAVVAAVSAITLSDIIRWFERGEPRARAWSARSVGSTVVRLSLRFRTENIR